MKRARSSWVDLKIEIVQSMGVIKIKRSYGFIQIYRIYQKCLRKSKTCGLDSLNRGGVEVHEAVVAQQ